MAWVAVQPDGDSFQGHFYNIMDIAIAAPMVYSSGGVKLWL